MNTTMPGFTAENSLGAPKGRYFGGAAAPVSLGVSLQLPIGGGPSGGTCCCLDCPWFDFLGAQGSGSGGFSSFAPDVSRISGVSRISSVGSQYHFGGCTFTCTPCPHMEGYCTCSCTADGMPCGTVGGLTVCESDPVVSS
jgi:hypothetical protein